ncbi:alkylation response protein AidB-like acyl-CoA dehydrogenase [Nocardioides zeae]|uniref:Alkylation response protein AidB-like acyl-CoA dehydrogenase n=1 Tax=Nocardioides zeae TaxID=1457234 RepID=A0ACC6IJG0_9ACTN|nr:acyl-CoA dehydrogenase family protein [Nocardioides zeae]MDR6174678.1 alkylation response protein AidB-like acyl-CoA dehydrogenase [Nocardioides zeae]MDR6210747.1 alkylation response protein AidB-like acyl-CoA dehydrogenase [Nocardioides zeae]
MNTQAERDELRSVVRSFLESAQDLAAVRAASRSGYDPTTWRRLTEELGLGAVGLPESHGGTGASLGDLVVVTEELGRLLDPGPYLPSLVLAGRLLTAAGGQEGLVAELAEGGRVATLVAAADGAVALSALERDGALLVSGAAATVVHGASADDLVVVADLDGAPVVLLVPAGGPGVDVRPLPAVDETRPLAEVELTDAPATLVAGAAAAAQAVADMLCSARIALAAELVGVAQGALDLTTAYAKERHQFGRAIGSFQAVKHRLVDVMMEIEASRTIVRRAAEAVDEADPRAAELSHLCKAAASDAAVLAGKAAVQVHGAIGFTWEHDAHLFLKRALGAGQMLGSARDHRRRIAALLLDGDAATHRTAATLEGAR